MPYNLVEHLLRNKKDAAIGVKYQDGDKITNMEGALHSLVTPVVKAVMQGDYKFAGTHIVPWFGEKDNFMLARPVIVSCLVQPDFEFDNVMLELCKLEDKPTIGIPFSDFTIPSPVEKRDRDARAEYDHQLKKHLVYYTVGTLPEKTSKSADIIETAGHKLSLKMLQKIITMQLAGEFAAISQLAPQGFVYTWDPPAIFAHYLNAPALSRLWTNAVADAVGSSTCKMIAFNDYADKSVIPNLKSKVDVPVISKAELFPETLVMPDSVKGCALVIHNNSDGFGQNIETEAAYGSLDGAIGSASSTSASLVRNRKDLLNNLLRV